MSFTQMTLRPQAELSGPVLASALSFDGNIGNSPAVSISSSQGGHKRDKVAIAYRNSLVDSLNIIGVITIEL